MSKNTPKEILYEAIREGNMEKVKEIVKRVNKSKKYPLQWGDVSMKKYPLHCGDESMKKFRNKWWNWIHYSAFFNKLEIVKYLVEVVKVDVNIQAILWVSRCKCYLDDTALHIAAREGFIPIIQYLLEVKGVKKDIKNCDGKRATDVCPTGIKMNYWLPSLNIIDTEKTKKIKESLDKIKNFVGKICKSLLENENRISESELRRIKLQTT